MIYFTKYAERKFEILNKHKVYFTREQIEDAVNVPDKTSRKSHYQVAHKENIGVVYTKEQGAIKIITFYPIK
jgi:hypothetical protein